MKNSAIGIDGCRGGWIIAVVEGKQIGIHKIESMKELADYEGENSICIIDMPVGLPSSIGEKRPDGDARKILGKKASTVFPVPCRQAVYAETINQAYAINEQVLGKKFTPLTTGFCRR